VVRRRGWPPSAPITKISVLPSFGQSKAIHRLSGDQRWLPVAGPPKEVSCTGLRPSRSQTQISRLPERSEEKAILLPSGENCSSMSRCLGAIHLSGAPLRSVEFGPAIRQMFGSTTPRA
jgi:hypothetical protein